MKSKKQSKNLIKKEYLVSEIDKLSKEEFDRICQLGWIAYKGKIFKVSKGEYKKIVEDYRRRNPDD